MKTRFVLMLLVLGLLLGSVFGFKAFINTQIDAYFDNMPMPTASITATEAKTDTWTPQVTAVGNLQAVQGTLLSTEVGGIVREILFESGREVRAGTALLRLDTETDQADLESLEAAARLAEQELRRARQLSQQANISEAEVQRRQSEAEQARARLLAQGARIAQKTLRAPFDGTLGLRRVNLGQFISPGDPIVLLEALDPIYVNFSLNEAWLGRVTPGQTIQVQLDTLNETRVGTISAFEPRVRTGSRSFEVQATLDNTDRQLRGGQFARILLAVGAPETVVVVPQTAVRYNPFGNSVFVIVPADEAASETPLVVRERFVETGERRGNLIRIVSGLEPGERIASSGLLKLQNGTPVIIRDAPRPDEDSSPHLPNA